MLSSNNKRDEVERSRQAGIHSFLSKPYRQADLLNCLLGVIASASAELQSKPAPESSSFAPGRINEINAGNTINNSLEGIRPKQRILLAEDNIVNQMVAKTQLEKFGYHVDVAANGSEAVGALLHIPYDLILMDCQMPEMDGYEATAAIRNREKETGRHIPIIAMTAHAIDGEREKCLAAGMDDYISKPVQKEALYKMIEKWTVNASKPAKTDNIEPRRTTGQNQVVDLERLQDLLPGDSAMIAEIIEQYIDQTAKQIEELDRAIKTRDSEALYNISHKALGGSSTCGMKLIVPVFKELESLGKNGQFDNAEDLMLTARSKFAEIRIECENLISPAYTS